MTPGPQWGIVELMGHRMAAGRVSEVQRFGVAMCQVEIPEGEGFRVALYGGSAIYGIHVTTEETARRAAGYSTPAPHSLHTLRALPAAYDDDDDDDDDEEIVSNLDAAGEPIDPAGGEA